MASAAIEQVSLGRAGSVGLTADLVDYGFDAFGIDWEGNRHQAKAPIMKIDLTTKSGQELVFRMFEKEHLVYIHASPPQ